MGFHPQFHQLDINDEESVKNLHDYIKNKYEGIDVLVNNAGIAFNVSYISFVDEQQFYLNLFQVSATEPFSQQAKETVHVNYFGTLLVSNGLFDLLRSDARVVNVSSSCGHLYKIPTEHLRKRFSDPNLTIEQLSALMNEFVT